MISTDAAEAIADLVLAKLAARNHRHNALGERTRALIKAAIIEACDEVCSDCGSSISDGRGCHCTNDE